MDSTPENAITHNEARNAERAAPTIDAETQAALVKLLEAVPFLQQWANGMNDLAATEHGEGMTAELLRLTRLGGIVGALITEARAHTREATRLSQARFPLREEADPPRAD